MELYFMNLHKKDNVSVHGSSNSELAYNMTGSMMDIANYTQWIEYQNVIFEHLTSNEEMMFRAKMVLSQPTNILGLILGILGIFSNIVCILAICQIHSSLLSHSYLLISLSTSDILIGLTVILYNIHAIINPAFYPGFGPNWARLQSRCMYLTIKSLHSTALLSNLLNLMGMAIDHYMSILRPLHYPSLMSKGRKHMMLGVFWVASFLIGFSDFLSGIIMYQKQQGVYNYCECVWFTHYLEEYFIYVIAFSCFVVMLYIYIIIYKEVQKYQRQEIRQPFKKNKKALVITLTIMGTFILCWLPKCLFNITLIIKVYINPESVQASSESFAKVDEYLFLLLLLNPVCDPLIYGSRLKEVQTGFRLLFNKSVCNKGLCYQSQTRSGSSPSRRSSRGQRSFSGYEMSTRNGLYHLAETNDELKINDNSTYV